MEWYDPRARDLPWKKTRDPYKIWLSEIILQQTRVDQGTPYYRAFVKKYPNVKVLASAPQNDVLKLWEGLGYYSRARNLHQAAREITERYNGRFPKEYEEIRALKGVGDYTAAAIASFAFELPYAVVDGNVYRVLSRVFGIELPVDGTAGKKYFRELAGKLLDKKQPGLYNQALMDFGALVCLPRNPGCRNCPFSSECKAYQQDRVYDFPVKTKAAVKKDRHFHYFVLMDKNGILIRQRSEKDIWEKLFEFYLLETKSSRAKIPEKLKLFLPRLPKPFSYKQVLSHRFIHGYFYEIRLKSLKHTEIAGMKRIPLQQLDRYAFPKIIHRYLQERYKSLS